MSAIMPSNTMRLKMVFRTFFRMFHASPLFTEKALYEFPHIYGGGTFTVGEICITGRTFFPMIDTYSWKPKGQKLQLT